MTPAIISRMINMRLEKCGIHYNFDTKCSMAFNGEGFYVNHNKKVNDRDVVNNTLPKIYAYDKHYAYVGAWKKYRFPLSEEFTNEETELGIYCIKYTWKKKRYPDFNYTIYNDKSDNDMYFISNIGYQVFIGMYESDVKIIKKFFFKNIGYLPLFDLADYLYSEKKKCKEEEKEVFEAGPYGLLAKKLNPSKFKDNKRIFFLDWVKYEKAFAYTGYEDVRDERVPIAMFQNDYLKLEEFNLFLKHRNDIVYMNTDSIFLQKPIFIEEDKGLGCYGVEYDGLPILFIRRNCYIILNEKMDAIVETRIGGATKESQKKITIDDVFDLINCNKELSLKTNFRTKTGNLVETDYKVNMGFLTNC